MHVMYLDIMRHLGTLFLEEYGKEMLGHIYCHQVRFIFGTPAFQPDDHINFQFNLIKESGFLYVAE